MQAEIQQVRVTGLGCAQYAVWGQASALQHPCTFQYWLQPRLQLMLGIKEMKLHLLKAVILATIGLSEVWKVLHR